MGAIRNRPVPQADLKLCQQCQGDVAHREFSSFEDILPIRMIYWESSLQYEKSLVEKLSLI